MSDIFASRGDRRPRVGPALAGLLLAALSGCSGSATLESAKSVSPANPLDDQESAVLTALNGYRAQTNLAAVANCASLNVSASAHSDDMRDHMYLSDTGLDGSTVRERACTAGYEGGCAMTIAMAELVSSGVSDPNAILAQWTASATTQAIIVNTNLEVVGIGQAFGAAPPVWTVDFGGANEASCTLP